eukprot:1202848-Amphidinium_carterae.1
MEENRDLYRDDVFCKQAVGNRGTDIALMCFRCLGDSENEPLKYCHRDKPGKPTVQFRQMVSRIQDAHRNTVRYLELAKKSGKYNVQIDPSLLRLMTSEFGGPSDFIKSLGPDNSVIMLYSCPSCNTAPLRIKDWLYGR